MTTLRRLPILLGMLVLLLPWAAQTANWLARQAGGAPLWQSPALRGLQPAAPVPDLTPASLWTGRAQRAATTAFTLALPLLPEAVQFRNQVYFSLLRQSAVPAVEIGQRLHLYEPAYVDEYCHRSIVRRSARMEREADAIADIQRWYAARGKLFLFLVTPSKAAVYPEFLPRRLDCPASQADRTGLRPAWQAILERHGVPVLDLATLVQRSRTAFPVELYPRGGTHWSSVASALAAQALASHLDAMPFPWKLPRFTFTWRPVQPEGVDRDITDLMNLPYPNLNYPAQAITVTADPGAACAPVRIGIVGGSFMDAIIDTLMQLPCPPQVDLYDYFTVDHIHYPGHIVQPVDPAERAQTLREGAEIVLLEENEAAIAHSHHVPLFADFLLGGIHPQPVMQGWTD